MKGTSHVASIRLNETTVIETISKSPYPNIVKYHGCRVQCGRIITIILERLEWTLT